DLEGREGRGLSCHRDEFNQLIPDLPTEHLRRTPPDHGETAESAGGLTRRWGRRASSFFGPIPLTCTSSSTLRKRPCASRCATIALAVEGPTPGSARRAFSPAAFRSSGFFGGGFFPPDSALGLPGFAPAAPAARI